MHLALASHCVEHSLFGLLFFWVFCSFCLAFHYTLMFALRLLHIFHFVDFLKFLEQKKKDNLWTCETFFRLSQSRPRAHLMNMNFYIICISGDIKVCRRFPPPAPEYVIMWIFIRIQISDRAGKRDCDIQHTPHCVRNGPVPKYS